MTTRYRVAAILGLDCGLAVYRLLAERTDIDVVAVFAKSPGSARGVAGYVDFSAHVPADGLIQYDSLEQIGQAVLDLGPLDLIVALGISEIVREPILSAAKRGCIGVHAARLPDRPGCAPIIWAIIDGLQETAVTLFRMQASIDSGPILDIEPVAIADEDTAGTVRRNADAAILRMIARSLPDILSGANRGRPQGSGPRHYTRKRGPRDGELDLGAPAAEVLRKIRALSQPYPGAHFYAGDGVPVVIERARLGEAALLYEGRRSAVRRNTVLCIVAHADDEALGVGGTLVRHAAEGDHVHVVIVSESESAKSSESARDTQRLERASAWCTAAGCSLHAIYGLPDQRLDQLPLIDIIQRIEADVEDLRPNVIYTHHPGDMNSDHRVVAQAVLAAIRPMTGRGGRVAEVLAFETPSSTDQAPHVVPFVFLPNRYAAVDGVWEQKMAALTVYANELKPHPHPRSPEMIEALARKRGAECGVGRAEAFVVLRSVWREE